MLFSRAFAACPRCRGLSLLHESGLQAVFVVGVVIVIVIVIVVVVVVVVVVVQKRVRDIGFHFAPEEAYDEIF
eukprot:4661237-Pyramimonas_sp.AAC.1